MKKGYVLNWEKAKKIIEENREKLHVVSAGLEATDMSWAFIFRNGRRIRPQGPYKGFFASTWDRPELLLVFQDGTRKRVSCAKRVPVEEITIELGRYVPDWWEEGAEKIKAH